MSGGSLDYVQHPIDDAARIIIQRSGDREDGLLLRAFAKHLFAIGEALHAIEWDFSNDSSLKEEDWAKIKALIGPKAGLEQAIEEAKKVSSALRRAIHEAEA